LIRPLFDQKANDVCAGYIKRKIRATVKDRAVAEKLIPKGYAYGAKRQPLDTNYYETCNASFPMPSSGRSRPSTAILRYSAPIQMRWASSTNISTNCLR
jgi:cation diffusion facilitator CzcD-associated flavoprotein CzcO